ncbi:exopolysaccharide biosynthesis protein [Alphaproteobacteria bacterium]|nr:exopolysaccharide biosynthesis protein [Alphaproteobacteria bacterium]
MENEEVLLTCVDAVEAPRYTSANKLYQRYMKRFFDVLVTGTGMIVIALPMIIVAIVVKATSKGPVLIRQKRIGKDGEHFTLYKFRSMVDRAEDILEELMANDPELRAEYLANKKLHDDPRITKIGKIIRCTSIDELPQLFNVLRGDMSLIGPRPYMPREKEEAAAYMDYITAFRPGITGMWQVSGRSKSSFAERLEFDRYYYHNNSFVLDAKIFVDTIRVVLKKDGAK